MRKCPRDMWLLFVYKMGEYSSYAATNLAVILWLTKDCGLGDVAAGSFTSAWSITLSVMGMCAGALVDTIGIRKTMFISVFFFIVARIAAAFLTNPALVFFFSFLPLGIGFAIVGPLISVGIKRYTTKEGAALGFGLFYVVMNLAFAAGGMFFDWIRGHYAARDTAGKIIDENAGAMLLGMHFSTYQMIFIFSLGTTVISLLAALFVREGLEMTDDGEVVIRPAESKGSGFAAVRKAAAETWAILSTTMRVRFFWI